MIKAERDALRALEAKATPGPWTEGDKNNDNHRFIAAARNSMRALLDDADAADDLIYAVKTWLLKSIHIPDDERHFVDGTLYDHIAAYDAKRRGGG